MGIALLGIGFLASRLPAMYLQPGGQDEECYAVPGLTILDSGIPRMPQLPSRDPKSVFYRSDEAVYLEPPLAFYVQAAFFAVLPHVYGTARLASAAAGLILMALMGRLALRCGATLAAALWGVGMFMLSRWFYFNSTMARPDTLCSAFGLLAILFTIRWQSARQTRWLMAAGSAIGLGGLTHPFALVYAFQIAGWMALTARRGQRVTAPLVVGVTAMLVASSWAILIVQYPETFRIQFRNQFIHDVGGSLVMRIVWPWPSLAYHLGTLWDHIGPWQFLLATGGWMVCGILGYRENRANLIAVWWLIPSSAWLLSALVGPHHAVFGYWSYPAALAFIGVGIGIDRLLSAVHGPKLLRQASVAFANVILVVSMIPGSGARTGLACLQHWGDVNYDAPRFAKSILSELPADATYVVDTEFALDFLVAGRRTLTSRELPANADGSPPYDYRIASRSESNFRRPSEWKEDLLWTRGIRDDPFACHVEVYEVQRDP